MSPTHRIAQALPEHQHASLAPSTPACLPETFTTQTPQSTPQHFTMWMEYHPPSVSPTNVPLS